jgi:hypothetical protein
MQIRSVMRCEVSWLGRVRAHCWCSIWTNGCDLRRLSIDYCAQNTAVPLLMHFQAIPRKHAFSVITL